MAELRTEPKETPRRVGPYGDAGQYEAIDQLLEAAGVPPDGGAADLDRVVGEESPAQMKPKAPQLADDVRAEPLAEEENPEEQAGSEEEEAPEEQEAAGDTEEGEEDAGAETEIDGAVLASVLGLGDADPESLKFNDEGELLFPWKVEDEQGTATVKDLVKGYQLNKNLTHKSEELTQARQMVEQERQQLHSTLDQAIAEAGTIAKTLQDRVAARFDKVDWAKMEADEGAGAVALRRQEMASEYQEYQREIEGLNEKAQKSSYEQREKFATQRNEFITKEAKALIGVIPDFGDADKAPALQTRMRSYLTNQGLNSKEIAAIIDHRQLNVIYDAMRWQESQKKVAKTIKQVVKVPRIRKGGSPRGKSEITREKRSTSMNRVRKSGDPFDAGRAMLDMGLVEDV